MFVNKEQGQAMGLHQVVLSATGLYTPPYAISNEELVNSFNQYVDQENNQYKDLIESGQRQALKHSSTEFIASASGILNRYVMNKSGILDPQRMYPLLAERSNDELSLQAEMGLQAAQQALTKAKLKGSDIDLVILATTNAQRAYPNVSIEIQSALQAQGYAYDISAACTSAVFALNAAYQAIACGSVKRALVINVEICSARINFKNRDSHFIFGDAATAMILENKTCVQETTQGFTLHSTALKTHYSSNIRNNFGFLNRCEQQDKVDIDQLFTQQGRKVFKEVCPAVSEHIQHHLSSLGISANQIKRFWLHQANKNMNELIMRKVLGRQASPQVAPIILDRFANTSSVGCVIAMHLYQDDLNAQDIAMLCSFGAGYAIASLVLCKN